MAEVESAIDIGADEIESQFAIDWRVAQDRAGAQVTLYKVTNGVRQKIGGKVRRLDSTGTADFQVKDKNGRRFTSYVAVVRSTSTTVADTSNAVRVR